MVWRHRPHHQDHDCDLPTLSVLPPPPSPPPSSPSGPPPAPSPEAGDCSSVTNHPNTQWLKTAVLFARCGGGLALWAGLRRGQLSGWLTGLRSRGGRQREAWTGSGDLGRQYWQGSWGQGPVLLPVASPEGQLRPVFTVAGLRPNGSRRERFSRRRRKSRSTLCAERCRSEPDARPARAREWRTGLQPRWGETTARLCHLPL